MEVGRNSPTGPGDFYMQLLLSTHLERDQLWIADNECTSDNVCKKNCGAVTCILYTL
jgi:hypothetical protein